jgi:L-lactate dehydrogenase complex protein LldG
MTERDSIISRIREALKVPAPRPGQEHEGALDHATVPPDGEFRQWLPAVGETSEERLALFQKNAAALKAELHLIGSREEFVRVLVGLRDREGWKKVASHASELTDAACRALGLPVCLTDHGYDVAELESCPVGISGCDALVAQTGSVLVTSRSAGGRALSVLPPHHVVLARRAQLLRDLPDAFAYLKQKYGANFPSFISFITGPSRTGDIERILVLGAHGPKKLTILLLGDDVPT